MDTIDRNVYGATETNGLVNAQEEINKVDFSRNVWLDDPDLVRVTRLRLISDPGFPVWDLSYAWGEMKDGSVVHLRFPVNQFSKRHLKADLIDMARSMGVFAKGLGLLDDGIISKCQ